MVQENLKVNIAIINNGYLGMVRQWQEFFYDRNYEATPLLSPNFVKLADAFGIRSRRRNAALAGGADGRNGAQAQGARAH